MKKLITIILIFLILIGIANAQPSFNPGTVEIREYGPILIHGHTLDDFLGSQENHPPTDGSAQTWSFYGNGDQIVTKGNTYWFLESGSSSWIIGNLKQKWSTCSNFPSDGVDVYSVNPETDEEFAFLGSYLFSMDKTEVCTINGIDWKGDWSDRASPLGNYPFKDNDKIDQFQFLDSDLQLIITGNQIWILGTDTSDLCQLPAEKPWQFCEPETLYERWVEMENHPPTDKVGLFAISYEPYYHIYTYDNYVWTLGQDSIWDTFRSGYDGYGVREPFFMYDNDNYYLYYDAIDAYSNWNTAVAVADHPKGPWKKLGKTEFVGNKRPWEEECSCASSIFKINDRYYNFYLGAPIYFGTDDISLRYRVPGFISGYYKLGLAVSDNPLGPFNRLPGDGTNQQSQTSDPPLLDYPSSGWHIGSTGSAQGTLFQLNNKYYYTYTSEDIAALKFGIGIAEAANILGLWSDNINPLLPITAQSENAGIIYDSKSGYYFMFSNAVSHPPHDNTDKWSNYWQNCGDPNSGSSTEGVALVMYWSRDLFNWDWENNYRVIASAQGTSYVNNGEEVTSNPYGCNGDSNYKPGESLLHRGNVGLGFPILVPEENKIYVAFDGNDFGSGEEIPKMRNHMFRNIYLLSIELPSDRKPSLVGDLNNDGFINLNDLSILIGLFGTANTESDLNNNGKVDIFDIVLLAKKLI